MFRPYTKAIIRLNHCKNNSTKVTSRTYQFNVVVRYNTLEQSIVLNISIFSSVVFSVVIHHSSVFSKPYECLCSSIVEKVPVCVSEVSHGEPLSSLSAVFTLYFLAISVGKVHKSFKTSLNLFSKANRSLVGPTQLLPELSNGEKSGRNVISNTIFILQSL